MKRMFRKLTSTLAGEHGATATEYSILVGFVAMVIVAGVGLFGTALNGYFGTLVNGVKAALGLP
ncbi:Flp family type IVb pilin [Arthrobacter sp. MMS24-S77]